MDFNLDGFSIIYINEDPNQVAENENATKDDSRPADIAVVSFPNLKFDDVKHLLYSGVKFVLFDLEHEMYDSSLYKTCTYSKERFPEKVFDNAADLEAFIKKNNIKAGAAEFETIPFSEFKLNSDGLIPCIAQDYRTGDVLMMAYMNEESYNKTLETGLMTYWSRSRQKLWTKGEESGHFQKMVNLIIDCDKDTILAKVDQTGPACHTGNPTCFFTPLTEGGTDGDKASFNVLQDVYDVIADRKANPKEGSYTNYLFDSGIDKILKKVGEECTEIVIAAKNPDDKEIKYEIADFLYHAMVLMAEKGVTWGEIMDELARRE